MGYNYKDIDKRRQEAPFLILEKNIYENLNVGSIAEVADIYSKDNVYKLKLKLIPKGVYVDCSNILDTLFKTVIEIDAETLEETNSEVLNLSRGDKVIVMFLDNYGTQELVEDTKVIMHDYKNAVVIGKLHI